jgi:chromosome segregation ATPase
VIQSILLFSLGFLCAGFLALMVAPAIWRRAVTLTRRRIEASVPLSLSEIHADKDRIRAEFAMSTRRLEMSIKSLREKAAAQVIEIGRNREEMKRLAGERAERDQALSQLEAKAGELRTELRQSEEQLRRAGEKIAETQKKVEEKALEMDKLGRMYDEAALNSSNRQIDLVARETEVEKLNGDLQEIRGQRNETEARAREIAAEGKMAVEALKVERKRSADLDMKVERLMATVADREEKLDRRERELARLREQAKGAVRAGGDLDERLSKAEADKARLESEVAEMTFQMSKLLSGARGGDIEKAMARLNDERDRLESRLAILARENKKLRTDLGVQERAKSQDWDEERRENALLREQINDLAAEVVSLTATLEGPGSPVHGVLAASQAPLPGKDPRDKITSLADRVRALQKSAPAS